MLKFFGSLFKSKPKQVVEILPQGISIELNAGQTILEAALEQGIAYPHNCTVGTCGACKTKLRQGQVKAISDFGYTLSKQELDAGYILACQAVPTESPIQVEIPSPGAELPPPEAFQATIVATEPLTHDIVKVTVKPDRPVPYVAGQYASFTAPGLPRARHYSFADAPQRTGREAVTFFIRKVPGGTFTDALFSGQLTGKTIPMNAPHGEFHLRGGNAPMVCIVGGSGLAPLLSVLEDARKNRIRRPCVLLFGARTEADLYMLDAIRNVAQGWLEPFDFVPVLSHEPEGSAWQGARGLVTDHIAAACKRFEGRTPEGYLCGPPGMIDAAIAKLTELGTPIDSIFYDKFTDGRDEVQAA